MELGLLPVVAAVVAFQPASVLRQPQMPLDGALIAAGGLCQPLARERMSLHRCCIKQVDPQLVLIGRPANVGQADASTVPDPA